jgi:hypothetical protein
MTRQKLFIVVIHTTLTPFFFVRYAHDLCVELLLRDCNW